MDIIEIALEHYTDFSKFELLANEIMTFEGYPHIKIIGGIGDSGIDAEDVKYYQNKTKNTIFQYSLQKNVSSKIVDTIEKLHKNNIKFTELVLVTNQQINNVGALKRKVREKYHNEIRLDIFERKTFITRLGTTHTSTFKRYFPNLRSQLDSDLLKKDVFFTDKSDKQLTISLLKCSLLFTFNTEAQKHRKDLFDNTILAILVDNGECSILQIKNILKISFSRELPEEQIQSSLNRLIKNKLSKNINSVNYKPTKVAYEKIEGNNARVTSSTQALINDILSKVNDILENKIDTKTLVIIERNIKKALSGFFRLHGLDYYNNNNKNENLYYNWDINNEQDLISKAKKNLSSKVGEVLVFSIGEVIKKPNYEQAEILAQWAKAFIGVQIMGLDPLLNDFQSKKISEKTFIIDTDFLLYAITENNGISKVYKKLLYHLTNLGCEIIIPKAVIYEVIKHAEIATRNYNYFRNTFDTIDEYIIEEKISNIFVKEYYTLKIKQIKDIDFQTHLENYYDKDEPYDYIVDVIYNKLSSKIQIKDITSLLQTKIPPFEFEKLSDEIYNETIKTFKSNYRDEEENKKIARNDANFYLTTYYLNKGLPRNKKRILNGKYYLITSSNRSVRCARRINIFADIIVKPQTLVSLLESIGQFSTSTEDVINLLENPFLATAINENWENIKSIVDSGVILKGKSIPRLKWDLETSIHNFISSNDVDTDETTKEDVTLEKYIQYAKEIEAKGYKLVPKMKQLISEFEGVKGNLEEKNIINSKLQVEVEKFGKRRQHYFNKISKDKK